ncbi:hypothetical protein PVAP13_9NG603200 [Panicum virgatum]|uniref:Uncharacterized protein n=1 Tax=Panicum virgatum TaxID=38727 RepID=A0A8T0MUI5_PANVG|nr:hypothetical protein PVAP13_9NG603200 [Panicum virgatum]
MFRLPRQIPESESPFANGALLLPVPRVGIAGAVVAPRRSTGSPPAMSADVRIVIRRHFPVVGPGGGTRIAEKVAQDIALRRRPSRRLRLPESVGRALADEVLPLVAHPFDRGAVAAARDEICAHVAAACDDQRIVRGGARVLVLIDTFACPVVFRPPPPCKPAPQRVVCAPGNLVATTATQSMDLEIKVPTKKPNPYGAIGDQRSKLLVEEAPKLEGFGTMAGWTESFSIFQS